MTTTTTTGTLSPLDPTGGGAHTPRFTEWQVGGRDNAEYQTLVKINQQRFEGRIQQGQHAVSRVANFILVPASEAMKFTMGPIMIVDGIFSAYDMGKYTLALMALALPFHKTAVEKQKAADKAAHEERSKKAFEVIFHEQEAVRAWDAGRTSGANPNLEWEKAYNVVNLVAALQGKAINAKREPAQFRNEFATAAMDAHTKFGAETTRIFGQPIGAILTNATAYENTHPGDGNSDPYFMKALIEEATSNLTLDTAGKIRNEGNKGPFEGVAALSLIAKYTGQAPLDASAFSRPELYAAYELAAKVVPDQGFVLDGAALDERMRLDRESRTSGLSPALGGSGAVARAGPAVGLSGP